MSDPEVMGDTQLFVRIMTQLKVIESLDTLEQLGEAWWLDASDRADGKLDIDLA